MSVSVNDLNVNHRLLNHILSKFGVCSLKIIKKVLVVGCCVCGTVSESNLVIDGKDKRFYCKHHTPTEVE